MSVSISINPTFDRLASAYQKAGHNLQESLKLAIEDFAFTIERYAKQVTPVDTGRLRSSIGVDKNIGGIAARVGTHNTGYARYVHEGTFRMRARPFMKWGLEFATTKFNDRTFSSRIDRSLRESLVKL